MSNISNQKSSLCPAYVLLIFAWLMHSSHVHFSNGPSVLAVCHLQGTEDMYYYSTTFSGGPGVCKTLCYRGSSNCVTGSSASPRKIPSRNSSIISTPPLTPDDSSDYSKDSGSSIMSETRKNDALDFLMTIFPHQGLSALPYAKSVSISAPNLGADFDGIVLELPGTLKTLYVDGKSAESVSLRESIVALLDLADESLGCTSLIIVLERSSPNLGSLLHSLMYVGGTVVTKPPFQVDPAFVLVGLEI
ncbi:ornithine decarboxylase antizyme-domain-containing protein [Flammula alnicola]|nr:ornithine decarboxylase antizyme-domain-containing protein [Flammula alnicola]